MVFWCGFSRSIYSSHPLDDMKRWVFYKYRIWRSQRFWKQFGSSGATVNDQLEFAKDNLTSGRLDTLWS